MHVDTLLPFRRHTMATKSTIFLDEALDLIGCTTILGVSYGIAFSLYCPCAWSLYLKIRQPDKRYQAGSTLGYITLLFFCATAYLSMNVRVIQLAYINHADFPGGPLRYEGSFDSATIPYDGAAEILDFVIEVLIMAIQVSGY